MDRIGARLLSETKEFLAGSRIINDGIDKSQLQERDLLTLLIKSNMAAVLPDSQRLSDQDVLARGSLILDWALGMHLSWNSRGSDVPRRRPRNNKVVLICHVVNVMTLILHMYNSTATTWALYALTQNLDAQSKLREELLSVDTDSPTMEELNSLSYLECVVREALRLHAPVPATSRCAMKDDIIPLEEPFVDTKGVAHYGLR